MANLKVKVERLSPVKTRVTVEVPHEEFKKKLDEAYEKLAKTTSIAGFRQGKVPREVLMQKFEGRILSEAGSALIDETFREALRQEEIMPLARPDFSVSKIEVDSPFIYSGSFEVLPEIDIKGYKGMEFEWKSTEVTPEEIDENLKKLCDSHAEFKPAKKTAEEGDMVMIDFEGFIGGKAIKDGVGKDYATVVGD
ncbi:MAG: trigger factor, partial [Proteobacteria bacterium]|nr:trigger factor [Pseudomonadota bacterium]